MALLMSLFDRLQIPTTASIINQHMTGRLGVALLLLERERERDLRSYYDARGSFLLIFGEIVKSWWGAAGRRVGLWG